MKLTKHCNTVNGNPRVMTNTKMRRWKRVVEKLVLVGNERTPKATADSCGSHWFGQKIESKRELPVPSSSRAAVRLGSFNWCGGRDGRPATATAGCSRRCRRAADRALPCHQRRRRLHWTEPEHPRARRCRSLSHRIYFSVLIQTNWLRNRLPFPSRWLTCTTS